MSASVPVGDGAEATSNDSDAAAKEEDEETSCMALLLITPGKGKVSMDTIPCREGHVDLEKLTIKKIVFLPR